MALNFPSSPVDGERYLIGNKAYVFSSTVGVWNVDPNVASALGMVDEAPSDGLLYARTDTGWSSINDFITDTPTLSGLTSVNETEALVVTITNYSATATYTITAVTATFVDNGDGTITVTGNSISVDTAGSISVSAKETNIPVSDAVTHNFTVVDVPIVEDQSLVYDSLNIATAFDTLANVDVTGGVITATAIDTTNIIGTSGVDTFDTTTTEVVDGDIVSVDGTDMVASGVISSNGSTNTLDIFGDSSGIGLYKFDGKLIDESGNYDATVYSGTTGYTTGKFSDCFIKSADGVGITTATYPSNTTFSISCWAYYDGTAGSLAIAGGGASWTSFVLHTSDTVGNFYVGTDTGTRILTTSSPLTLNAFTHVVLVIESTVMNVYIDGVNLISNATVTATTGLSELIIGSYDTATTTYTATVDQYRVFDRALTLTEVTSLYNEIEFLVTVPTTTVTAGATPTTAYINEHRALSVEVVQDATDTDFVGLKTSTLSGRPFQSKQTFSNISTATVADTLTTFTKIVDGDKLAIVKDDASINEVVASGVTSSPYGNSYDVVGSIITLDATKKISTRDGSASSWAESNSYGEFPITSGNVYWEFVVNADVNQTAGITTDITYQANSVGIVATGWEYRKAPDTLNNSVILVYGSAWTIGGRVGIRYSFDTGELEFYNDGVSQGIAYTLAVNTAVYPTASMSEPDEVIELKTDISELLYLPAECITYSDASKYSMDTTATTAGEIPARAYAVDSQPSFKFGAGYEESVTASDTYTGGNSIVSSIDPFGDGSLGYKYQFEGDTIELIGGTTATPTGITYVAGTYGQASSFVIGSSFIETAIPIPETASSFSFSADIAFTATSTDYQTAISNYDATGTFIFVKMLIDQTLTFETRDTDSVAYTVTSSVVATLGQVYSIVCVIDSLNATMSMFIDGVLEGTVAIGAASIFGQASSSLSLGRFNITAASSTRDFDGSIDQFEFYNKALTQVEADILNTQVDTLTTTRLFDDLVATTTSTTLETKMSLKAVGDTATLLEAEITKVG